jgi:hypothetical protein
VKNDLYPYYIIVICVVLVGFVFLVLFCSLNFGVNI